MDAAWMSVRFPPCPQNVTMLTLEPNRICANQGSAADVAAMTHQGTSPVEFYCRRLQGSLLQPPHTLNFQQRKALSKQSVESLKGSIKSGDNLAT